jgi:hypothetical protein
MNVSEQIISVLDYLGKKFGIAIDWSSENILPIIQTLCEKYIRWEISTSIMWIALAIVSVGLYALVIKIYDKCADPDDKWEFDYNPLPGLLVAFGVVITVSSFIDIGVQVYDIIKCCTFPELKVFEYVSTLIENL